MRNGAAQPTVAAKTNVAEVATGEAAPDFVATELASGTSSRLGGQSGKPVVLVFFRHESPLAVVALEAAAKLNSRAVVAAMCTSDDPMAALRMTRDNGLSLPVYDGREAAKRYAVSATPRFVVIDENGVIRQLIDGYGSEIDAILLKTVDSAGCAR
jgi:peroxiredoxin